MILREKLVDKDVIAELQSSQCYSELAMIKMGLIVN